MTIANGVTRWLAFAIACHVLACTDGSTTEPAAGDVPPLGATMLGGAAGASGAAGVSGAVAGGTPTLAGTGGSGSGGSMPAGGAVAGAPVAGFAMAGADAGAGNGGVAGDAGDTALGGSGGDGAAGGSAIDAGAPAAFAPCPTTEPCRILPLGDSITDGIGFSGGYRVELFRKALVDGKRITFVGRSMNGPSSVDGVPFPQSHEGHSGWTIGQIDGIVPDPALSPDPHIVLLHIGTNDMYRSPAMAPEQLAELIDQIVAELPDALLVVATIIPFPGAAGAVDTFNAAIPPLVEARAAEGKHVVLVDQFTGFPTSELGDGVHPNEAGYARMAGVWYEAVRDLLP